MQYHEIPLGFENGKPTSRIKTVEYRRLVTTGSYNNVTYGGVAEVADGASTDDVLAELKAWVDAQFDKEESFRRDSAACERVARKIDNLTYEQREVERKLAAAREVWKRAVAFLEKHGVTEDSIDQIPF